MLWICWIGLTLTSAAIIYQDFKSRLISIWLIVAFTIINITQYLLAHSIYQLLENSIFCACYFLFSFLVLFLFYYLKNRRFERIIDSKIGWGDVLIFLSIGICIEPMHLIFFFTGAFVFSILFFFLFLRSKSSIPLAGLIIPSYIVYIFVILPLFNCWKIIFVNNLNTHQIIPLIK